MIRRSSNLVLSFYAYPLYKGIRLQNTLQVQDAIFFSRGKKPNETILTYGQH